MKLLRPRPLFLALALLAGTVASLPASAQWIWKDAQGRFNSSDRPPPPDVPERNIIQRGTLRPATPAPAASAASSPEAGKAAVDPELEARRRQQGEQPQAQLPPADALRQQQEQRQALARAEACERARSYMRTLETGGRLARVNQQGQREFLSDEARQAEMDRARESMAANCQ